MRKATFPVLDGNGRTIIPVPPVSGYAYYPVADEGGTTANRPVSPGPRQSYYDTDLLEEITYNAGRARWENYMGESRAALPANTVAPAVTGTLTVGDTLTTTNGTWTGDPTITYARQWKRDGVAISGATGLTYLLVVGDVGANISCTVTATNAGGSVSANSNAVGPVVAAG